VFFDPSDRFVERSSSGEDALDPDLLERRDIPFGNDTADDDQDVINLLFSHLLHQFFADRQVGSGHNRKADDVHPLLDGRMGDLIHGLMKAGVNHLHPRVAEGLRHYFGPSIVAVQPGFCNQDTNFFLHLFTPLESPAANSGDEYYLFFSEPR